MKTIWLLDGLPPLAFVTFEAHCPKCSATRMHGGQADRQGRVEHPRCPNCKVLVNAITRTLQVRP